MVPMRSIFAATLTMTTVLEVSAVAEEANPRTASAVTTVASADARADDRGRSTRGNDDCAYAGIVAISNWLEFEAGRRSHGIAGHQ